MRSRRRACRAFLLAAIVVPALVSGGIAAAAEAPLPRPRPTLPSEAEAAPPEADASVQSAEAAEVRVPRPRPDPDLAAELTDLAARFTSAAGDAPGVGAEEVVVTATSADEGDASGPQELLGPATARTAFAALADLAREPRPRPEPPTNVLALIAPEEVQPPEAPLGPQIPAESEADYAACLSRLRALGVVFTEEEPIDPTGACHVEHPLNVKSIGSGISITPEAILNCRTTEALALWARDVMVPAARRHLNAVPEQIVHGSAYVCRPRNNQAGARLSEHATANAFDISSIRFADRDPVDIGVSDARGERTFQTAAREGSCQYFTTVLGPGSNAAHATHFHFDVAQRRGGHRLCDMGGEAQTAGQ